MQADRGVAPIRRRSILWTYDAVKSWFAGTIVAPMAIGLLVACGSESSSPNNPNRPEGTTSGDTGGVPDGGSGGGDIDAAAPDTSIDRTEDREQDSVARDVPDVRGEEERLDSSPESMSDSEA